MRSALRRHQSLQRAVLSQVDCFVQCEVVGSKISLDGIQPHNTTAILTVYLAVLVVLWIAQTGQHRIICLFVSDYFSSAYELILASLHEYFFNNILSG